MSSVNTRHQRILLHKTFNSAASDFNDKSIQGNQAQILLRKPPMYLILEILTIH